MSVNIIFERSYSVELRFRIPWNISLNSLVWSMKKIPKFHGIKCFPQKKKNMHYVDPSHRVLVGAHRYTSLKWIASWHAFPENGSGNIPHHSRQRQYFYRKTNICSSTDKHDVPNVFFVIFHTNQRSTASNTKNYSWVLQTNCTKINIWIICIQRIIVCNFQSLQQYFKKSTHFLVPYSPIFNSRFFLIFNAF